MTGLLVLLAADSDSDYLDVPPAAGVAVIVIAVLCGLGIVAVRRSRRLTRITPAGAGMELRAEPPAVVDLLTGGFTVEDDAVPATVVDLAARRWFAIEDYGDETIIRTRQRRPPDDTLTPYETRVLEFVEHHAIDGILPTRVLTTGPKGASQRWWKGFAREVVRHSQQLGLSVDRFGIREKAAAWVLAAASIGAAGLVAAATSKEEQVPFATTGNLLWGIGAVLTALVAWGAAGIARGHAQRDTPAGVEAAAHWMGVRDFYRTSGEFSEKSAASVAIWDHHLAYATALGLAHEVQRQIPFETEHDRHAWSRATGQWRRVKVRYHTLRPAWGASPLRVTLVSALVTAVLAFLAVNAVRIGRGLWRDRLDDFTTVSTDVERWIEFGATLAALALILLAGFFAVRFLLGATDLFRHGTVEGIAVRCRERGGGDDSEPRYYVAIDAATRDNGLDDTILAYRVRPAVYRQVAQGDRVRADVSPLLGFVRTIEVLERAAPLPSAADDGSTGLAAAGDLAGALTTGIAGWVMRKQQEALAAADPTQREAYRRQFAEVLDDPEVANSPAGAAIREFLAGVDDAGEAASGDAASGAPLPPPDAP